MRFALSVLLLCITITTSYAQNIEKKAKKFMKKFGLEQCEMYHISNKTFAGKYAKGGFYNFPINYLYDEGKQVTFITLRTEKVYPPFTYFQTMAKDLDTIMLLSVVDSVGDNAQAYRSIVVDSLNISWAFENIKPVFNDDRNNKGRYKFVIYFPLGMSVFYKKIYPYYDDLIKKIKQYKSKDVELFFVLVPMLSKT